MITRTDPVILPPDRATDEYSVVAAQIHVALVRWQFAVLGLFLRQLDEWLDLHRDELMENWVRLSNSEAAKKIEPLK